MAVPGHDERDFDFAQQYDIPIRRVLVMAENGDASAPMTKAEVDLGWMVNSPMEGFDGLHGGEAKAAVCQALEAKDRGHQTINWKIRPWLISRQRYWHPSPPFIAVLAVLSPSPKRTCRLNFLETLCLVRKSA